MIVEHRVVLASADFLSAPVAFGISPTKIIVAKQHEEDWLQARSVRPPFNGILYQVLVGLPAFLRDSMISCFEADVNTLPVNAGTLARDVN